MDHLYCVEKNTLKITKVKVEDQSEKLIYISFKGEHSWRTINKAKMEDTYNEYFYCLESAKEFIVRELQAQMIKYCMQNSKEQIKIEKLQESEVDYK